MGLGQDIPWREVISPRGRNTRGRFWVVVFCYAITSALLRLLVITFDNQALTLGIFPFFLLVSAVNVINAIRRLHDIGRSGWWLLLLVAIAIICGLLARYAPDEATADLEAGVSEFLNIVALLLIGFWPSQRAANRFGPWAADKRASEQPA